MVSVYRYGRSMSVDRGSNSNMVARILVVDDERMVTEVVERYLRREGYEVTVADDGFQALLIAQQWPADLVVLDLMLPGVDGLEVCRQLRQETQVPIIMLTARAEEADRIVGLELGADDYMVKPFSPRELTARVKSVLRRSLAAPGLLPGGLVRHGALAIDARTRGVTSGGREISLRHSDLAGRRGAALLSFAPAPA